jgi:hypothetical protein
MKSVFFRWQKKLPRPAAATGALEKPPTAAVVRMGGDHENGFRHDPGIALMAGEVPQIEPELTSRREFEGVGGRCYFRACTLPMKSPC